jgi:hypothetical protein
MDWIGWLLAAGLGVAYFASNKQKDRAQRALLTLQMEIPKLAALWAAEIKKRRGLEDEYERSTETVQAECLRRFRAAEEPLSLVRMSDFDSSNDSLLNSRHEILHPSLLESDPAFWAKQFMTMALTFVSKRA